VRARLGTLALAAAMAWACADENPLVPVQPAPPVVLAAGIVPNPTNVLSVLVSVRVTGADSVAVRYHLPGSLPGGDSVAPAVAPSGDSALVPVLGLLPATGYMLRAVAYGGGDSAAGDSIPFASDTLPADLPRYTAGGSDPSPGYVVFAAGKYGLVIDNTGRVVWYHRFDPGGPGLNFMAQPNGRYVARPTTPATDDLDLWVEVEPLGNVTRTFGCANGLQARFHDLIAEPDGGYWIMCDETRVMDLTASGGVAGARVMGTAVQHVGPGGVLLFEWSPFDHLGITDLDSASRTGATVNWTHGNALTLDGGGNLLVSFRSLNELAKINTTTGDVMWRMGGSRGQFAFVGTPAPAFLGQHGLRLAGPDTLVVLDNAGDPGESRVERYVFDARVLAARLLDSYGAAPPVRAPLGGSVQPLPNGRLLVAYGNGARVEEYDATGTVVWRIEGNPGYVFRAQRILSLYHPEAGLAR